MFNVPSFFGFKGGAGFDPDALAFFARVDAATGVSDYLTSTEKSAVNDLVIQMKSDGIWTKMKAIYPMVGGGNGTLVQNQASCEQNLVSASFTGAFTSGWTFASTGVTPNGTSAYMDTGLIPNNDLQLNDVHGSSYIRNNVVVDGPVFSSENAGFSNGFYIWPRYSSSIYSIRANDDTSSQGASSDSRGFWILRRNSSTVKTLWRNSSQFGTHNVNSTNLNTSSIYLGASRNNSNYSTFQNAFTSFGDGLTDTEASNFYTAVQAFQTTLSRAIAP